MRRTILAGAVVLAAVFVTPLSAATSYTYDSLGRLWIVTYDNGYQVTYNYDSAGNRTTVVTQSGSSLPPVANNVYANVVVNGSTSVYPLPYDSDPNGYSLSIATVGTAAHAGTPGYTTPNTYVTYTPPSNYTGNDSFPYTISDGHGHTATATIYMTVSNVGPVANPDTVSTAMNAAVTYYPLSNDVEPNPPNYTLSIASVGSPGHGSVVINTGSPPSLTYTPANSYTGNDSFTYTISDGHGLQSTAADSVVVGSPPVAVADYVLTPVNTLVTYDPLGNDSDPNNYNLSILSTTAPTHGTANIVGGNSIAYTPTTPSGYSGADTFNYTISDGHGLTASALETICVGSTPLTANANSVSIFGIKYAPYTPNTTLRIPRSNDTDACGATFTVTSVTQPSQGSVVINTGGVSVSYTSNYQLNSGNTPLQVTDTFTYTITDSYGATSTATVTVHINVRYSGG